MDADWAWFAGIIDGEGSIVTNKAPCSGRHYAKLQVSNTDMGIINKIRNILLEHCLTFSESVRIPSYCPGVVKRNLDIHSITISSCWVVKFLLERIIPYLCGVKGERARLALENIKGREIRTDGRRSNRRKKPSMLDRMWCPTI